MKAVVTVKYGPPDGLQPLGGGQARPFDLEHEFVTLGTSSLD
jgi:hypothetical protein